MVWLSTSPSLAFSFGLAGNIISFMAYLSPVPMFYRIIKKKSTEGFHSVPYVVSLFSAMLWIYYALVKTNSHPLITINSIGCVIETAYISLFVVYAPKKGKVYTVAQVLVLNVVAFGSIILLTLRFASSSSRVHVVGWICAGFSVAVFVAPLSIIRLVILTKSVEFMPLLLSLFLTLNAIAWLGYGMVTKDRYIEIPNVLGIVCGVAQIGLYACYMDRKGGGKCTGLAVSAGAGSEVHPIDVRPEEQLEERRSAVENTGSNMTNQRDDHEGHAGVESCEIQLRP